MQAFSWVLVIMTGVGLSANLYAYEAWRDTPREFDPPTSQLFNIQGFNLNQLEELVLPPVWEIEG